jgi:hypothetical protein
MCECKSTPKFILRQTILISVRTEDFSAGDVNCPLYEELCVFLLRDKLSKPPASLAQVLIPLIRSLLLPAVIADNIV